MNGGKFDFLYWLVRADSGDFPPKRRVAPPPVPANFDADGAALRRVFADGGVGYFRAIVRTEDVLERLRELVRVSGRFDPHICNQAERDALWLRYPGDEDFKFEAENSPPRYAAINPRATPGLFACADVPALVALEELHRKFERAKSRLSSAASYEDRFGCGTSPDADAAQAEVQTFVDELMTRVTKLRTECPSVVDVWASLQIERCRLEWKSYSEDGGARYSLECGIKQWEEVRTGAREFADDAGMLYAHKGRSMELWRAFGF